MKWMKALIENGVVYVKVNGFDHQTRVRKDFINSALYNDMKIKTTIGCWINPETCETEKVMRIELLSTPTLKPKKKPKIDERDIFITETLYTEHGLTMEQIAKRYSLSKQRVAQIIKRVKELRGKENQNEQI